MLLHTVSTNLLYEAAASRPALAKAVSNLLFMANLSSNKVLNELSLENIPQLYEEWKRFAQQNPQLIPMGTRVLSDFPMFNAPEVEATKLLELIEDLYLEPEFYNQVRRRTVHRWYMTLPESYTMADFAQMETAFEEGTEHAGVDELMHLMQVVALEILIIEGLA